MDPARDASDCVSASGSIEGGGAGGVRIDWQTNYVRN